MSRLGGAEYDPRMDESTAVKPEKVRVMRDHNPPCFIGALQLKPVGSADKAHVRSEYCADAAPLKTICDGATEMLVELKLYPLQAMTLG